MIAVPVPVPVPDDDPLLAPGEAMLDDPLMEEAARLLAMGEPDVRIAEVVGRDRSTVCRWKQRPAFAARVKALRKRIWDEGDGIAARFYPPSVARAARALENVDDEVAIKAAGLLMGHRTKVGPMPDRPLVAIQNNLGVGVPGAEWVAPPVATWEMFVRDDLGLPLASVWPRVQWVGERADTWDHVREVVLCSGKASGKGVEASLFLARGLQKLLALRSPAEFFGLMPGSTVGVINLSASGQEQAQVVIFNELARWVEGSRWFQKYAPPSRVVDGAMEWPSGVKAICGNSQSRGAEGIAFIYGAADEVCRLPEADQQRVQSAAALIDPVKATMVSRFGRHHKLLLMSWPDSEDDFLHDRMTRARKSGIKHDLTAEFLASPLTRGTPEEEAARRAAVLQPPFNEYPTEVHLTNDGTLIVHCPMWQMNPRADLEELASEAAKNPVDFARMSGARPRRVGSTSFIDAEALRQRANPDRRHPVELDGRLADWWQANKGVLYYAHMDAGFRDDAFGFAVTHWEDGRPRLDLALEIKPPPGGEVDKKVVLDLIAEMQKRGATFARITHDQYNGIALEQDVRALGIEGATLSVDRDKRAYLVWKSCSLDGTFDFYAYEPLFECAASLLDLGKKIDHRSKARGGKKDASDAVAGALWNVLVDMGEFAGIRLPAAEDAVDRREAGLALPYDPTRISETREEPKR